MFLIHPLAASHNKDVLLLRW